MAQELGESAKLAVAHAQRLSQELNHFYIGVEHLFLGIAELKDYAIGKQFSDAGADLTDIAWEVRNEIGTGTGPIRDQLFLTPRAEKVIESSIGEARRLGTGDVEAPHILISILEDGKGVPARKLLHYHVDLQRLAQGLRDMLSRGEWNPEFYRERKTVEQPGIETTVGVLENLGRDLTEMARKGELDPIIGRDEEIFKTIQILGGRRKNCPLVVGEAGVGKTAIVEGLAQLIAAGDAPPGLDDKYIRTVEIGALVAGTIYRGQFEERLQALIEKAEKDKNLIIFIDEIHTLIGAGEAGTGSLDAANILKPALSRGKFKCIGATTTTEYRKYIEKDAALERRFQPVFLGEPSSEATLRILQGLRPRYEEFHGVKILDEALEASVSLSTRYISGRYLPDKAIDVMDQACSKKKLRTYFGQRNPGEPPREEQEAGLTGQELVSRKKILMITAEDVTRIISDWTGIPLGKLTETESGKLLDLESLMKQRVVGQDEAVSAVARAIRKSRSGIADPKRPIGSFLFLGPTGVGKTELAKTLAGILFDDEEKMVRIDMSEYFDKSSISRMVGSAHGYVDSDRGGVLTEAVKKNPYSVVLFDEVEKADPDVLNLMLQIMSDGRLTDGLGRKVNFRNTIIIMTSNIGSAQIQGGTKIGFILKDEEQQDREASIREIKSAVDRELKRVLAPEFLNRIDEIVIFNPLEKKHLRDIAKLMLARIPVIAVEADRRSLDFLVAAGYEPTMGARPLLRTIDDHVVEPLANEIIRGNISEKDVIRLGLAKGRITFKKASPVKGEPQHV